VNFTTQKFAESIIDFLFDFVTRSVPNTHTHTHAHTIKYALGSNRFSQSFYFAILFGQMDSKTTLKNMAPFKMLLLCVTSSLGVHVDLDLLLLQMIERSHK
jgi:hypothetical protein